MPPRSIARLGQGRQTKRSAGCGGPADEPMGTSLSWPATIPRSPRFALHGVSGIHLINEHRHYRAPIHQYNCRLRVKKKGTGAMSGKPGRSGRKSFVATPEQRNNVKILVGLGIPQAMICQLVVNPQTGKPLDEGTLKKHFPREIAVGAAE